MPFVYSQVPHCYPNWVTQPQKQSKPSPSALSFLPYCYNHCKQVHLLSCSYCSMTLCVINGCGENNSTFFSHRGGTSSHVPSFVSDAFLALPLALLICKSRVFLLLFVLTTVSVPLNTTALRYIGLLSMRSTTMYQISSSTTVCVHNFRKTINNKLPVW